MHFYHYDSIELLPCCFKDIDWQVAQTEHHNYYDQHFGGSSSSPQLFSSRIIL